MNRLPQDPLSPGNVSLGHMTPEERLIAIGEYVLAKNVECTVTMPADELDAFKLQMAVRFPAVVVVGAVVAELPGHVQVKLGPEGTPATPAEYRRAPGQVSRDVETIEQAVATMSLYREREVARGTMSEHESDLVRRACGMLLWAAGANDPEFEHYLGQLQREMCAEDN